MALNLRHLTRDLVEWTKFHWVRLSFATEESEERERELEEQAEEWQERRELQEEVVLQRRLIGSWRKLVWWEICMIYEL